MVLCCCGGDSTITTQLLHAISYRSMYIIHGCCVGWDSKQHRGLEKGFPVKSVDALSWNGKWCCPLALVSFTSRHVGVDSAEQAGSEKKLRKCRRTSNGNNTGTAYLRWFCSRGLQLTAAGCSVIWVGRLAVCEMLR